MDNIHAVKETILAAEKKPLDWSCCTSVQYLYKVGLSLTTH